MTTRQSVRCRERRGSAQGRLITLKHAMETSNNRSKKCWNCSVCRTMQPESSPRLRGGLMPNRRCVNYSGCRFNNELTRLQGVCVDIQDSVHVCITVPQPTHQPSRQRTDTTLDGYAPLLIQPFSLTDFAKRSFRCAVPCLELTSCVCHPKRLAVCYQI